MIIEYRVINEFGSVLWIGTDGAVPWMARALGHTIEKRTVTRVESEWEPSHTYPIPGPAGCRDCGHPSAQHDDGGCMYPRWNKNGGTTCGCAGFGEPS